MAEIKNKEVKYFDYDLCKSCGGKCCTRCAGTYDPTDFKEEITADFIVGLLNTGKFAIDWWEGDAKGGKLSVTYYLRPRHVNEGAIKGSWGGVCVNWSKVGGCSLTEEKRPFQCRKLVPNIDTDECTTEKSDKATKRDCAVRWYEHQQILKDAVNKYDGE